MINTVRAAGGIIWRNAKNDTKSEHFEAADLEIIVIHRPSYLDWSFPKGKVDPGETEPECAIREVIEETGLVCELQVELPSVHYIDRGGKDKTVRYWKMVETGGKNTESPKPSPVAYGEVDIVRWVSVEEAFDLLTYERDKIVLKDFVETFDFI